MPKVQINCWLSPDAATRLKTLSQQQKKSYGEVLTGLLLESPEPRPQDALAALAAIEQRLSAVEQTLVSHETLSPLATDSGNVSRETLSPLATDSGKQIYIRLASEEQATWKQRIRQLRAQNMSYGKISKQVYQEGLCGQDGLPLGTSTITRICKVAPSACG
jgi:hypothetical protein